LISEEKSEYISLDDLWKMAPKQRLSYLKKQWELVDECVYGEINVHDTGKFCILKNVKNINAASLEYPIASNEIANIKKRVADFGIFAKDSWDLPERKLVRASLTLSSEKECIKSGNPLSVQIQSPEPITFIPPAFVTTDIHGNMIITESIKQFIIEEKKEEITEKTKKLDAILDKKEILLQKATTLSDTRKTELIEINKEIEKTNTEISNKNERIEQLATNIEEEKNKLYQIKNQCEIENNNEIMKLEKVKKETRLKMIELKKYVCSKADFLRDLKLISQEQFDYVTGNTEITVKDNEGRLDFNKDLDDDFDKLIFQIQTYLYSKDKYYTKATLQSFLTLLRTNDLIIISGPSGTGKSYLVNSFAQAIGAVAKIIPVKPNWTSSEDLLGYYNPIQKSYITTPFLDAIVAAKRDPKRLHLICLDEMNLARVEYYFADFLSVLEQREKPPIIHLYSNEESEHIKSEFRTIIDIFERSRVALPAARFSDFGEFLHHKEITQSLQEIFGNNENNSLVDLYGKLRRMIGGVLNIPADFEFPSNVRIIGTINIDQTTHYFAPKVLDRAYLLKFESPLTHIDLVDEEVSGMDDNPSPVYLPPGIFWTNRKTYPKFDSNSTIASKFGEWNRDFLSPLGIEVGMRVMRQALLFQELYRDLQSERSDQLFDSDTLNIILLMKVLPHFMFDGDLRGIKENSEVKKHDLVKQFAAEINVTIRPTIEESSARNASTELQRMIQGAEHNDKVYNYWT